MKIRVPNEFSIIRIPVKNGIDQLKQTIIAIGNAINSGSQYLPIRNYAAALATTAAPKDFIGQLHAVYTDFLKRWRYVKDPFRHELVTRSPKAIWRLVMGGDGVGVGLGRGAGDCDDATVAIGSILESIGFPVRLATTSKRSHPRSLYSHVFAQAFVPKVGWVTVDPVLHPSKGFGDIADYSRIAYWDLNGNLLGLGNNDNIELGGKKMNQNVVPSVDSWRDFGGLAGLDDDPEPYSEPVEWSSVGLRDYGSLVPQMGLLSGENLGGLAVEIDSDDEFYRGGTVRTPLLEMSPEDYRYMARFGSPYDGMLGLGDDGQVYAYDGLSGFFKKMFRKARKAIKRVGKRIKGAVHKVLKRSKFGRGLIKIGGKIRKVAMKIVKPLIKFVGKYAAKLAPIAALIPGFGPAVAAGLYASGKIAKIMLKHGAFLKGKKGSVRDIVFKGKSGQGALQRDLAIAAQKLAAQRQRSRA